MPDEKIDSRDFSGYIKRLKEISEYAQQIASVIEKNPQNETNKSIAWAFHSLASKASNGQYEASDRAVQFEGAKKPQY